MVLESIGLALSEELFQWPQILFYFFIPLGLFILAIKFALDHFRIFGRTPIVNWGIAVVISLLTLLFIPGIGTWAAIASLFVIGTFKLGGLKGVILGVILAIIYWLVIPMLIDLLTF